MPDGPHPVNPQGAVFLSYASEDAEAAKRICESLRAAGIEVWFDRSELRGGDAWDQNIRQQIQLCALFVPVISANTQSRPEGYFRLEWKLAVDRSHLMSDDYPFLVPVVVDGTPDSAARVPARFRERQWTRIAEGKSTSAFVERVARLLDGEQKAAPAATQVVKRVSAERKSRRSVAITLSLVAAGALIAVVLLWLRSAKPEFPGSTASPGANSSPADDLLARATPLRKDLRDSSPPRRRSIPRIIC
jgi:hypothetical protein